MLELERLTVSEFINLFRVIDARGKVIKMSDRYSASLIVPLSGKIRFTQRGRVIVADARTPIFVPGGTAYINECAESAESLMFNFNTAERFEDIEPLPHIPPEIAGAHYDAIYRITAGNRPGARQAALSELYALFGKIIAAGARYDRSEELFRRAAETVALRFSDSSFGCAEIAESIGVGRTYLRTLFSKYASATPHEYLADFRLSRARLLMLEGRLVKEAAAESGYPDPYQFSRAYKIKFGKSPSEDAKLAEY